MRKLFAIAVALLAALSLASCANRQGFFGTYTFSEVSYLSPVSSATADYMNEKMAGTKYTIKSDVFMVEFDDATVQIVSPTYRKEQIPTVYDPLADASCVIGNEIEHQYTIYDADGKNTHWRIYESPTELWISSFVDNTADGSEIILNIFKIS